MQMFTGTKKKKKTFNMLSSRGISQIVSFFFLPREQTKSVHRVNQFSPSVGQVCSSFLRLLSFALFYCPFLLCSLPEVVSQNIHSFNSGSAHSQFLHLRHRRTQQQEKEQEKENHTVKLFVLDQEINFHVFMLSLRTGF